MSIGATDRIEMNQRERDTLSVMKPVLEGTRTQAEAARLLDLSVRQVRRLQRRLEAEGDAAVVHRLRGKPSNRQAKGALRDAALAAYRARYPDFGPTLACEKLAEHERLKVGRETLRRWLLDAGLWAPRRARDPHRSRRPRRRCFGELVQFDASVHDWLEGRGQQGLVLLTLIDDATSRLMARFYLEGTTETHMDLLSRWLGKHGRPVALYTDRHGIFEAQAKGEALPQEATQFGRALEELDVELIRAHSPQAKGRVERSFGTAQDRWVKELRLAGAKTLQEANAVLAKVVPAHNRRFAKAAKDPSDAHRPLGPGHDLGAILCVQQQRVVSNDYVVRLDGRHYQLLPPALPGLRGGRVTIEQRRDGPMKIRFGRAYLSYREIKGRPSPRRPAPRASRRLGRPGQGPRGQERAASAPGRHTGQRPITPGGSHSSRRSDTALPPDISNGHEQRTFLLGCDRTEGRVVPSRGRVARLTLCRVLLPA
jgi:hypothetical protein